jgi:hypothetical protein
LVNVFNDMTLCCTFLYFVMCIQGVDNYSFVFSLYKWGREAHLGPPVLVHLICTEKIQMSNCQLPEYTLQNTKMYNIISNPIQNRQDKNLPQERCHLSSVATKTRE